MGNFATFAMELAMVIGAAAATDKLTEEPEALLRVIGSRTAAHLSQLPNYTCHEVVNRMLRRGSTWNHRDTVEFEVAFVGREELFSRPGEERFGERSIGELAPGTISNGVLGSQIDMIFASDAAEFRFVGTAKKDGHKTFRYDLRVSQDKSGFKVKHDSAEAIVPFEGSVWDDGFGGIRSEEHTSELQSHLNLVCRLLLEKKNKITRITSECQVACRSGIQSPE